MVHFSFEWLGTVLGPIESQTDEEVRSVVTSSHEKQGGSAYGKRKLFEKKCQLSNEELRHQSTPVLMRDFRKFQQWQRQRVSPHHKFQLALQPRLAKLADKYTISQRMYANMRPIGTSFSAGAGRGSPTQTIDKARQSAAVSTQPPTAGSVA